MAFEERLAWNRHLAAAGYTCLGWPEEHGGRGLSVAHRVAFYEEYAIANAPAKVNHFGEELLGPTLIAYGTPEQKARFTPTFRAYAESVYRNRLDDYHGEALKVTGSTVRKPGDDEPFRIGLGKSLDLTEAEAQRPALTASCCTDTMRASRRALWALLSMR